jgi:hypothetical protein
MAGWQPLLHIGGFVSLALFIPILCTFSIVWKRSRNRKKMLIMEETYALKHETYYRLWKSFNRDYKDLPWEQIVPTLVILVIGTYFSAVFVWTPELLSADVDAKQTSALSNILLLGAFYPKHRAPNLQDAQGIVRAFTAMCFAYLGWYVWTISTVFARLTTMEVVSSTFVSILMRLVVAVFVALVLDQLGPLLGLTDAAIVASSAGAAATASSATQAYFSVAVGFGVGLFPDTALHWLSSTLKRRLLNETDDANQFPLDLIQGISAFRKFRLYELGMDDAENLALINAIDLYLASNLSMMEVIDWISQAQLLIFVGREKFGKLQENSYRTAMDFVEAAPAVTDTLKRLLGYDDAQIIDLARRMQAHPAYERLAELAAKVR